jgi:DNA-binding NarL/FixJ family response regulator
MLNPELAGSIVSVIIADDHAIIRDAIRDLLVSGTEGPEVQYNVITTAENGLETVAAVKNHRPDLLVLDVAMPLGTGAEIIRDLRQWSPSTRIAVFTGIAAAGTLAGLVEAGADGLFSKANPPSAMVAKFPLLLSGGRYVAPEFTELIRLGQQSGTLTDRERQVLNRLVAGRSNREIAAELYISPKTVEKHRASLMNKLEAHSVVQLMARALSEGLIDPATNPMG